MRLVIKHDIGLDRPYLYPGLEEVKDGLAPPAAKKTRRISMSENRTAAVHAGGWSLELHGRSRIQEVYQSQLVEMKRSSFRTTLACCLSEQAKSHVKLLTMGPSEFH